MCHTRPSKKLGGEITTNSIGVMQFLRWHRYSLTAVMRNDQLEILLPTLWIGEYDPIANTKDAEIPL